MSGTHRSFRAAQIARRLLPGSTADLESFPQSEDGRSALACCQGVLTARLGLLLTTEQLQRLQSETRRDVEPAW